MKIFLVYMAGPYQADTEKAVLENIQIAISRALGVVKEFGPSVYPVTPHALGLFDLFEDVLTREEHLAGVIEIMRRCDVVYFPSIKMVDMTPGQLQEFREAVRLQIPCAGSLPHLKEIIASLRGEQAVEGRVQGAVLQLTGRN